MAMWHSFKRRLRAWWRRDDHAVGDWRQENAARIARLRGAGVRIGEDCVVFTENFSTEPFLVQLGNHVGVAGGVHFLTHDGSVWVMRDRHPDVQHFGRIVVGDNSYIGQNSLILAGAKIGRDCIIGAGAVVRGEVPDNSLVVGNPGRVIGRASLALERMLLSEDTFHSFSWAADRRRSTLEAHFGGTAATRRDGEAVS